MSLLGTHVSVFLREYLESIARRSSIERPSVPGYTIFWSEAAAPTAADEEDDDDDDDDDEEEEEIICLFCASIDFIICLRDSGVTGVSGVTGDVSRVTGILAVTGVSGVLP